MFLLGYITDMLKFSVKNNFSIKDYVIVFLGTILLGIFGVLSNNDTSGLFFNDMIYTFGALAGCFVISLGITARDVR